jgi:hypothetical protein
MVPLQRREQEIFQRLKEMKKQKFAIVGGYAVNAYTPTPRFSVDCDIFAHSEEDLRQIIQLLKKAGYKETSTKELGLPYYGTFTRYEKEVAKNMSASFDMFLHELRDRRTTSSFTTKWIFDYSHKKILKGKTIAESAEFTLVDIDALMVMKFVSNRDSDIRDIFMLAPFVKDIQWIQTEIGQRFSFNELYENVKKSILSKEFRDNLHGTFGSLPEKAFEKHKKAVLKLER